jgi:hypothetical protein
MHWGFGGSGVSMERGKGQCRQNGDEGAMEFAFLEKKNPSTWRSGDVFRRVMSAL